MKAGGGLNIALLDEDKFASSGMKMLLYGSYHSIARVDVFYSLNDLMDLCPLAWDIIIIDVNSIDFTLLDIFTWLDKVYELHNKRPKILFTHRYPKAQFPLAILEFYSENIYNKEEGLRVFLKRVSDILDDRDSLIVARPHITITEKEILMELARRRSIGYLSRISGKEKKTLYSHKNSALAKLGVASSEHFFACYNSEKLLGLMRLSCFMQQ